MTAAHGIIGLIRLARPHWPSYASGILALLAGTGLFLLLPQQLGQLIQLISGPPQTLQMSLLAPVAMTIGAIFIGQALLMAVYSYLISLVAERIGNELRAAFFCQMISRPVTANGEKQLGAVASEFSSDLAIIQLGLSDSLVAFLRHAIFTLGAFIALFLVDVSMAAISLLSVLVVAGVITVFMRLAHQAVLRLQKRRAEILAFLVEAVANAYVIQAYQRVSYFNKRFRSQLDRAYGEITHNTRLMVFISPVSLLVFGVAIGVILAVGLQAVAQGRIDTAGLIAFLSYVMILVVSVSQLGMTLGRIRQSASIYDKQKPLLQTVAAAGAEMDPGPLLASDASGFIFDKVSYRYPQARTPVLNEVSFSIPAGKITAIVGESGAGKSTVVALLANLLQPATGAVYCAAGSGQIALVPQNCFLFSDSIRENIRFGRHWLTDEQVERAACAAQIHQFILGLPDRYSHQIEEGGANFSRGQQQRIALARALCGQPSVLLMDEATASMDVISERAIRHVLQRLRGSMTIVVIAHKGEMLSDVDHLIVLDQGNIVYEGKPECAQGVGGVVDLLPQLSITNKIAEIADAT